MQAEFVKQTVLTEYRSMKYSAIIYLMINLMQFINLIYFNLFPLNQYFYFNLIFRVIIFFIVLALSLSHYSLLLNRKKMIYSYNVIMITYWSYYYFQTANITMLSFLEFIFGIGFTFKMCIFFKDSFFLMIYLVIFIVLYDLILYRNSLGYYPELIFIMAVISLCLFSKRKKQMNSIIKFNEEKQCLNVKSKYNVLITNLLPIHVIFFNS